MGLTHKTITICGSTRFKKEIQEAYEKLTLEGNIVFPVGVFNNGETLNRDQRNLLELIHMEKIKRSDAIFVINKHGYIGDDTSFEIAYAESEGIEVKYLEDINKKKVHLDELSGCDCRACASSEGSAEIHENSDKLINSFLSSIFGLAGIIPDIIVMPSQDGTSKVININNIKKEDKPRE
jgi:hypothetical protein